jgi:cytochrome c biogenesis factor
MKRKALLVAKNCGDPGGYIPNSSLHIGPILGFPDSDRNDGCTMVFFHFIVGGVDLLVILAAIMDYSCLTVVRNHNLATPPKYWYIWIWAVIHAGCLLLIKAST